MIFKNIPKLIKYLKIYLKSPYFGFIQGHIHLNKLKIRKLKSFINKHDSKIIMQYEKQFSNLIGKGFCISYASARMGFYEIMEAINITENDEVIILGSTCSVMINAILRRKAIPRFSDINPETFGSDYKSIKEKINSRTKLIVAQHSFGIPCNIKPIVRLAKQKKIFLIEDCALTLGSKIEGKIVGNFGDAAIFSTDHSKPINTIIGGFVYTKNKELFFELKEMQKNLPSLNKSKQIAIWNQLNFEKNYCHPNSYGKFAFANKIRNYTKKYFGGEEAFLIDDFYSYPGKNYPYPAKIPTFLAALGLIEIKRWPKIRRERIDNMQRLIKFFESREKQIPPIYKKKDIEIIPLRFVWVEKNQLIMKKLSDFIDTSWIWFKKPIIETIGPLKNYKYKIGSCPLSEIIGKEVVNLPLNLKKNEFILLEKNLKKTFKKFI